jgi:DNA-binding SARP family transcriptional activator
MTLGDDRSRLESTPGGYRLDIPENAVDAVRFERLVREGEQLRAARETASALSTFDAALALWSGEPLSGVPGPYAQRHRRRLIDLKLNAQVARLECAYELGDGAHVATELTALIADHPLREDLYSLRMRALHDAGRSGEALAVYSAARETLVAELGMDPGPELRELQARILRGVESATAATAASTGTDREAPTTAAHVSEPAQAGKRISARPQQLPPAPGDFVGRERLQERVRITLRTSEDVVPLTVLSGIGGVGKTALALRVAHRIRGDYPDGQLYMDLRGDGDQPADPADVLVDFLLGLGVPEAENPKTLTARAGAYRTLTVDRRILVLLDNAFDAAQVAPLLPWPSAPPA